MATEMANEINVVMMPLDELTPYENNPRKNDEAVQYVMASIQEFGFKVPLVVDSFGVIVAGHTRYKAAKKLKMKEVPCVVADDLDDEQIKAFRLADNKTAELSDWDLDLLGKELAGIDGLDMGLFGFNLGEGLDEDEEDNPYTWDINIPQYQIKGERPDIADLVDRARASQLMEHIVAAAEAGTISREERDFLMWAAERHSVFHFGKIAEYYANASATMQGLMEESALVIIDVDDAIAKGFVHLTDELTTRLGLDDEGEDDDEG